MWHSILPWYEFIFRGLIVSVFLLVILRLTGKRQVGQLAPFDLILLLILSNAVQNAMNGGDNTVTAGLVSACTLVAVNGLVGWSPRMLIHNGHLNEKILRAERVTHHELMAALRRAGCDAIRQVHLAVL